MEEEGRIIGRIPGGKDNSLLFKPSEKVLGPKVSMGPGGEQRPGMDIFLSCAEYESGASGIRHMDKQYEGIDPDEMLSGEIHEETIFQASDLYGRAGE